jgi:hypothetical protein
MYNINAFYRDNGNGRIIFYDQNSISSGIFSTNKLTQPAFPYSMEVPHMRDL